MIELGQALELKFPRQVEGGQNTVLVLLVQGYDMENRCTCGEGTNLEKLKILCIYLLVGT